MTYLSNDTAIKLYTEAVTDTPCIYGTVLHMNQPSIHAVNDIEILYGENIVLHNITFAYNYYYSRAGKQITKRYGKLNTCTLPAVFIIC